MTYVYRCEQCKTEKEIVLSLKDDVPKTLVCDVCGGTCHRDWKAAIHIPEYMKATSDIYNSNTGANMDYIKRRMKIRPSGREKIYW